MEWSARAPMTVGILGMIILLGGFGTWSITTTLSGAIIASGQVEVDRNRQIVQHPDGGVVAEIAVDEGDTVTQGQLLVRLDDNLLQSELNLIEGQLFELMARRGRLAAERDSVANIAFDPELQARGQSNLTIQSLMDGQIRLFEARKQSTAQEIEQLSKRRDQIENQILGIEAQQAALDTQSTLLAQELEDQKNLLEKGLTQAARVSTLERQQAEISGNIGRLAASRAEAAGRITELNIEILRRNSARREEAITELRELQFREINAAEQRRSLQERLDRLDIRAPVSGIIYGMTVFTPRSVIRAADPLMYLVPQDRPLIIASQVQPINIDQVYVGQEVTIRLAAFDQRTTPELIGTVVQLSADAFTDQSTNVSYYRAEIELLEGELSKLPQDKTLIPGMPVESFIRTEDRSPLVYLTKPLIDYFARAMRES